MGKIYSLILFATVLDWHAGQSQTVDTLVQVGHHHLHFHIIKGNDQPILFESGNGDDGQVWKDLLPAIYDATGATLITYDRAGLGKSDIDTLKISLQQEIKDLHEALKKLGFKKDYFLVAHSFGGMYASAFANENKGKIKGAVFIEVSTPCQLTDEYTTRVKHTISAENWAMLKERRIGLYYVLQQFPEIAAYMSTRYLSEAIPLTVIAAEHYKPTPQIGETEADMRHWQTCLAELGNLPNHTYVVTKDTEHKICKKDPDTIIAEVTKLYHQTQGNP